MIPTFDQLSELARPPRGCDLLLQVIAGDDVTAAAAWQAWRATRSSIEGATGAEWRLLSAVGRRMANLDKDPVRVAQLAAVKRKVWHDNQLRLNANLWILDKLAARGIPMMVLKGGARIAVESGAMETRVVRDLDLLFPEDRLAEAVDTLMAMGLRSINGHLPGKMKSLPFAPIVQAGPRPRGYMEIDIHAAPLRFGRLGSREEGLWRRARPAHLFRVPVLVPSPSDRFVQAIAHGLVADEDRPVDWVVDALRAARDTAFDPAVVAAEVRTRRLGVPVSLGIAYLVDRLGLVLPDAIREACRRDVASPLFRLEMAHSLVLGRKRSPADRALVVLSEMVRSGRRRRPPPLPRTAYVLKPSPRRPAEDWLGFVNGSASFAMPAPSGAAGGRLCLRFAWDESRPGNHSFDVLLGGLWIGRIRLRGARWLGRMLHRSWSVSLPYGSTDEDDPRRLTVVLLDERKMPTLEAPAGLRVACEFQAG